MTNKKDTAVILVELLEQAKERKKNFEENLSSYKEFFTQNVKDDNVKKFVNNISTECTPDPFKVLLNIIKDGLTEVKEGEVLPSKVLERGELYKHGDALYTSYTYPYMISQTEESTNTPSPLLYIKVNEGDNIVLRVECILPNE